MNAMKIFMAFVLMLIIGFFAVGFTSSVQEPDDNTTAGQQYNNLSKVTKIAAVGIDATTLVLVGAMLFAALFFMATAIRRKR